MCVATDTYDIALAAENVDLVAAVFDGDPADPNANEKLNFDKTFAFYDFRVQTNPHDHMISDIDCTPTRQQIRPELDYFTLFEFSAK